MTYEKAWYVNYRAFSVSRFGPVPLLSRRYLALLVLFFLVVLICPLGVPMAVQRRLVAAFVWTEVDGYNLEHRHSGIRYVSPHQRHAGEDRAILRSAIRRAGWERHTRDWSPIGPVTLNPERDAIVATHVQGNPIQPMAA